MATIIRLNGVKFNNPDLPIVDVDTHPAKSGLIAEWDMHTILGNALQDLSGNGYHANLGQTPNCEFTNAGVKYPAGSNGHNVAISPLQSPAKDFTMFVLVRRDYIGQNGFAMAAWEFGGYGIWWPGDPSKLNAITGTSALPNGLDQQVEQWCLVMLSIDSVGNVTFKDLLSDYVETGQQGKYGQVPISVGGAYYGVDGASPIPQSPCNGATIAYTGMYNKVLNEYEQSVLLEYVQGKMLDRGVVIDRSV